MEVRCGHSLSSLYEDLYYTEIAINQVDYLGTYINKRPRDLAAALRPPLHVCYYLGIVHAT